MRVYLSGGPDRTRHWGLANRKADVKKLLHVLCPDMTFVHSGQSDYIVIPDYLDEPSDTAMKTGGRVMKLSAFVRKLKRTSDDVEAYQEAVKHSKSKTKKKSSKTKSSSRSKSRRRRK